MAEAGVSRRTLLKGIGAATLLTGVSGCGGSGGRERMQFHLSKPEAIPYFRKLIDQFNASQQEIEVVFDTASNLQAGFLRGNPPDLGLLNYNMEMARFMERGALSDLSDMAETKRILPEVQKLVDQYATYPGRVSVLPYSVMAASVIYNKKMFAEHDLEVPTTWEQLLAVCATLAKNDVLPFYATYAEPWSVAQGWFDYSVGGMVDVARFFERLRAEGTSVGPNSPVSFEKDFAEPVERMKQLSDTYTNKDAASRGYGDGNLAFAQGKAAMYLQGPWAFGEIAKTSPDLQLGCFPLPMTDDPASRKVRVNIDLAAWIPQDSEHKEAARRFLTYLFRPEVMNEYNKAQLGYGTTTDSAPVTDSRIVDMKPYYEKALFYQGPSKAIPLTIPTENYMQGVVTGSPVVPTLRTLDADWARLALRQ